MQTQDLTGECVWLFDSIDRVSFLCSARRAAASPRTNASYVYLTVTPFGLFWICQRSIGHQELSAGYVYFRPQQTIRANGPGPPHLEGG